MKGSIKTLVAILVLVGGALETNSMDAAETPQRVVPDKEAKKLCFQFLKNELRNYILLDDVKSMLKKLREENRREWNFDKNIATVALHEMPISCPELVDFVRKVVNANDNCRWLTENKNVALQAMEIFSFDMRTSEVYLAYKACDRLSSLEIKKIHYQLVYDAFLENYKQIDIPNVGTLIAENEKVQKDLQKDKELAITCEGILDKEQAVLDNMMKSRPNSEERVIFDHIAIETFTMELNKIKHIRDAVRFCLEFLARRQSRPSVTEGTSQVAGSNHDQMQE